MNSKYICQWTRFISLLFRINNCNFEVLIKIIIIDTFTKDLLQNKFNYDLVVKMIVYIIPYLYKLGSRMKKVKKRWSKLKRWVLVNFDHIKICFKMNSIISLSLSPWWTKKLTRYMINPFERDTKSWNSTKIEDNTH